MVHPHPHHLVQGYKFKPRSFTEVAQARLPRGVKYIQPPKLFKSKYMDGCYADYDPPPAENLPPTHIVSKAQASPFLIRTLIANPPHATDLYFSRAVSHALLSLSAWWLVQAKKTEKAGQGVSFNIVGAMPLAPTRFLKGRATKAWVEYVGTTGRNNQFQNLQTSAQAANEAMEQKKIPSAARYLARAGFRGW